MTGLVPLLEEPLTQNYIEEILQTPKRSKIAGCRNLYDNVTPSTSTQVEDHALDLRSADKNIAQETSIDLNDNLTTQKNSQIASKDDKELPQLHDISSNEKNPHLIENTYDFSGNALDSTLTPENCSYEDDDDDDSTYRPSSTTTDSVDSFSSDESVVADFTESSQSEVELQEVVNTLDEWIDIDSETPTNIEDFTEKFKTNIPEGIKSPIDIYKLFVTDEIINKMVEETNKYAETYIQSATLKNASRAKKWIPTDYNEMCVFMGILITMGLVKLPSIYCYWSKKSCYRNDYICSLMSRDRFILMLKFWHFSENSSINPNSDKLSKIRTSFKLIQDKIFEVLEPGKYLVIDETMIPWRGRLKFRQYIKNKAHSYGIKLYKLCTAEGYTVAIIIYTGKLQENFDKPHGQATVIKLIQGLEKEGRVVIADNFYTSVELAYELLKKKMMLCGTIRVNKKKLPKEAVINKKLKRGQVIGKMTRNGIKIIKWQDKRPVTMITSCKSHTATAIHTGKFNKRTGEPILKPECVTMYNQNKKGVDYSDQMTAYYTTLKKGIKWYRKLMMSILFGTCMVNAWIVHKENNEKKLNLLDFTEAVIESLTKKKMTDTVLLEKKGNKIHTFEKRSNRKRCALCYQELRLTMKSRDAEKKAKQVFTICVECNKPMCLNCFNKYHSQPGL